MHMARGGGGGGGGGGKEWAKRIQLNLKKWMREHVGKARGDRDLVRTNREENKDTHYLSSAHKPMANSAWAQQTALVTKVHEKALRANLEGPNTRLVLAKGKRPKTPTAAGSLNSITTQAMPVGALSQAIDLLLSSNWEFSHFLQSKSAIIRAQ